MFALGIVLIEIGLQAEQRRGNLIITVGGQLMRNPLVIAPLVGVLVPLIGLTIPPPAKSLLEMLGAAAAPCALVTLGLFLADRQESVERDTLTTFALTGTKLILQPAVTWALATYVFELSALQTHIAVLIAALPTGTGPFMLAEFYRRDGTVTSNVILASTVLSLLTITAYLALIG